MREWAKRTSASETYLPMENDIYMIINDTSYDVTKDNGNNNYCVVLVILTGIRMFIIIPRFHYQSLEHIIWEVFMVGTVR